MAKTRSSRRERQAAATKQDILKAARRLFAEHGYVATSMAAIAEEADTAVQTIYDSVGPKRSIMLALVTMAEEDAGVGEFRDQLIQARDPKMALALWVTMTRQFLDRSADIVGALQSAAAAEPDVAAAYAEAKRNHQTGANQTGNLLERLDALAPGLTAQRAGAIIALLTWGTTWQELLQDHGWSLDECETWMVESLIRLLLRDNPQA
jgi:AcrR family transcriptional regulator